MYQGEKLNSISHVVGDALALVGLGALLAVSLPTRDPWIISSFSVFGVTTVLLYTMSALYHGLRPEKLKRLFQIFDHVAIYLLIAGTYTPFMLVTLREGSGVLLCSAIWGLALLGSLAEVFARGRVARAAQLVAYLGMGWSCFLDFSSLKLALDPTGLKWLLAGGAAYSAGVLFYVLGKKERLAHAHGIWHVFVLLGTLCHFISILGYVR